jgi:hypothetical protein
MNEPRSHEQVLQHAAELAAARVVGATNTGPVVRGSAPGVGILSPTPLTAWEVLHARTWALNSDMAANAHSDAGRHEGRPAGSVPVVLPDAVMRVPADGLNAGALLAAQACAAAEAAVLLNALREKVARVAALERLYSVASQLEALDGQAP